MTHTASSFEAGALPVPTSFPLQQAETRAVEAALDALPQEEQAGPSLARNAHFMLARCLDYPAEAERLYHLLTEDGAVFEQRELRRQLVGLGDLCAARAGILARLGALLKDVADLAAERAARFAEIAPAAERLVQLRARTQAFLAWLDRPRAAVDRKMIEESRAAFARGEYEEVEAIIQRLRAGEAVHEG